MNDKQQEIYEGFKETILEISDFSPEAFSADTVIADIGLESLDFVEIQVSVMKRYGVQLDPDVFMSGEIKTINQLVLYVLEGTNAAQRRVASAAAASA